MQELTFLVVGDINIDIVVRGLDSLPEMGQEKFVSDIDYCLGGSAANTACALAKLGANVEIWTKVADDYFGPILLQTLKNVGVGTKYIRVMPNRKSGLSIGLTNSVDRSFISFAGTNRELDLSELSDTQIQSANHLHVSGFDWGKNLGDYENLLKRAKSFGLTTSLDLGWTDFELYGGRLLGLLQHVDYFFPNEVEALALTGTSNLSEALVRLRENITVPIITLGRRGAIALWNKTQIYVPGFPVTSIDSIGAGDAFDAGFLWAILHGRKLRDALRIGNACGALTSMGAGGGQSAPSQESLQTFLNSWDEELMKERG